MVHAHGKLATKSFIIPRMVNRKGMNVMLMASVAEKIDLKKCVALFMDACQRDTPSEIISK